MGRACESPNRVLSRRFCLISRHFRTPQPAVGGMATLVAADVAELLRGVRLDPNDEDVAYFVVGLLDVKSSAVRACRNQLFVWPLDRHSCRDLKV